MLRIGLPNKGTLSEPAAVMLREAGYRQRSDTRDLVLIDPENEVEFFYLRPRDIATYVAEGQVEVGITGRDTEGLISEGVLAIEMGALAEDMALSIHPHPTLSETEGEAAEIFLGSATHILPKSLHPKNDE